MRQRVWDQAQLVGTAVRHMGQGIEVGCAAPRSLNLVFQVDVDVLSKLYFGIPHRDLRAGCAWPWLGALSRMED